MAKKVSGKSKNVLQGKTKDIFRQLVADIQGAPFPNNIGSELYTIWYEHAQSIAVIALEYLNELDAVQDDE